MCFLLCYKVNYLMSISILDYLLHFSDIMGSSMLETKLLNYLNYYNEFQVGKYWEKNFVLSSKTTWLLHERRISTFHQCQLVLNSDVQKLLVTIDVLIAWNSDVYTIYTPSVLDSTRFSNSCRGFFLLLSFHSFNKYLC